MNLKLTGVLALAAALTLACAVGARRRTRVSHAQAASSELALHPDDLGVVLGSGGTLVQFSTGSCASCRSARRVLGALADRLEGVRYVELEATEHVELVRTLDIHRTPTVLVLDPSGRIVSRVVGVPSVGALVGALAVTPLAGT